MEIELKNFGWILFKTFLESRKEIDKVFGFERRFGKGGEKKGFYLEKGLFIFEMWGE